MRGIMGIAAAAVLLAGCHHHRPAALAVKRAWVRLPAVPANPGAAYFVVHGGDKPTSLVAVSAPFAVRAEMHETMGSGDGMTAMKPLSQVAIPAHAKVAFAPGGKHVMLFDLSPKVTPGSSAPITLSFANGEKIEAEARIVGAGDPEPK